jgi:predicted XRE-type DNA-binding protein
MSNDPKDVFRLYDMRAGDECWQWLGGWTGRKRETRPTFTSNKRRTMAYRWVYELVHGVTLTPGQQILHSCDKGGYPTGCGNPKHLSVGTREENTRDMIERERHGLPKNVVRAIRQLLSQGQTQEEVAALYGISRSAVSAIAIGRIHSHVASSTDGPSEPDVLPSGLDPKE